MFRFPIRDALWLTCVAALVIGTVVQHYRYNELHVQYNALSARHENTKWTLDNLVQLIEERDGQVMVSDDAVALYIVAKNWQSGPGWSSKSKR